MKYFHIFYMPKTALFSVIGPWAFIRENTIIIVFDKPFEHCLYDTRLLHLQLCECSYTIKREANTALWMCFKPVYQLHDLLELQTTEPLTRINIHIRLYSSNTIFLFWDHTYIALSLYTYMLLPILFTGSDNTKP